MTPRLKLLPVLAVCCLAAEARAAESITLHRYRAAYEREMEKTEEKAVEEEKLAPGKYLALLQRLERFYQMSGDLKPLIAVRTERQRFEKNSAIPEITPSETPQKLGDLQKQFLSDYAEIPLDKARRIVDLTGQYVAYLTDLQRDLTRQDKIDEALKVLAEIERVQADKRVKQAKFTLAAKGASLEPKRVDAALQMIDADELGRKLAAEILSWNSRTLEVRLKYSFDSEDQAADWKGGNVDVLKRLVCNRQTAVLRPQFDGISRIEYEGILMEGGGPVVLSLSGGLFAHIGGGINGNKNLLFQNSEYFPICGVAHAVERLARQVSSLALDDADVVWEVNGKLMAKEPLQQPVNMPTQVSLGSDRNRTAYDNVVVAGVLNKAYLASLLD